MPWVWNHTFTAVNAMATRKKGTVCNSSRRGKKAAGSETHETFSGKSILSEVPVTFSSRGYNHQTMPSNSAGITATEPLLSIANTNVARLSQYQRKQWEVDSGQWAVPCLAATRRGADLTKFKYHNIDNKKNNIAIMFFRCAIQATDCTFTGCNANVPARNSTARRCSTPCNCRSERCRPAR